MKTIYLTPCPNTETFIKTLVANVLFSAFASCYIVFNLLLEAPNWLSNGSYAVFGLLSFLFVSFCTGNSKNKTIAFFAVFFLSFFFIASYVFKQNAAATNLLWIWGYMGIALLFVCFDINEKLCEAMFYIVAASVFLQMVLYNDFTMVIKSGGSQNNISSLLIFFMVLYVYVSNKNQLKISYLPAFITVALSLWTECRGGLFASLVFLFGLLFLDIVCLRKKAGTLFLFILITIVFVFVFIQFFSSVVDSFLDRMNQYGTSSSRFDIWSEYFRGMFNSVSNFVFGVSNKDTNYPMLIRYKGNTHNIYLMMHEKFGLGGFLAMIIAFLGTMRILLRRKKLIYLLCLLTCMIRGFFDWIAFPGFFDILFYIFLLTAMTCEQNEKGVQLACNLRIK